VGITPQGLLVGSPGAARLTLIPSTVRKGTYTGLHPSQGRPLTGGTLFGYAIAP
jgi:hypothetical protein